MDASLWQGFFWPLLRLLVGMACGLLLASFLESLRWSDKLAHLGGPLARAAHLGPIPASAFGLAFFSPAAANAQLSEAFLQEKISRRELVLANLFNGLPAFFSHAPTLFLLTWPALGFAAVWYVGISLLAAILRIITTILLGRWLLPASKSFFTAARERIEPFAQRLRQAPANAWRRFKKRILRLALYTAPVYALMYVAQKYGFFRFLQDWMAQHLAGLPLLEPQAMGIIVLQLLAEMGAALGAASAAMQDGSLSMRSIVLAMLVGNVLATPLRAIRHQLPSYAGFYAPGLALMLVVANQSLRAFSMICMIAAFVWLTG